MLMCAYFGLLLCTRRRLATHFLWLAVGCASLCVLYFADTWVAAAGEYFYMSLTQVHIILHAATTWCHTNESIDILVDT
jgi:hypothetical protein